MAVPGIDDAYGCERGSTDSEFIVGHLAVELDSPSSSPQPDLRQ
jgi:hypothetical protein